MIKSVFYFFTFTFLHINVYSQTLPLKRITSTDTTNFTIPYSTFFNPHTNETLRHSSRNSIYESLGAYYVLREVQDSLKFLLVLEHGTYKLLQDIENKRYYLDTETTTQFLREYRVVTEPKSYLQGVFNYALNKCSNIDHVDFNSAQFAEQFMQSLVKKYNLSCGESLPIGPNTKNHLKKSLIPLPETGTIKLNSGITFEIAFNLNNFLNYERLQLKHLSIPLNSIHSVVHNNQIYLVEKYKGSYKVLTLNMNGALQLLTQFAESKIYIKKGDKLVLLQQKERMEGGKLAVLDEYKGYLKVFTRDSKTISPTEIDKIPLEYEAISQLVMKYNNENASPLIEKPPSHSEFDTNKVHASRDTKFRIIPILTASIGTGTIKESRHNLSIASIGGCLGLRLPISYSYSTMPRIWITPEFGIDYQKGTGSTIFEDKQFSRKVEKTAFYSIWSLYSGLDASLLVYNLKKHHFLLGAGVRLKYGSNKNSRTDLYLVNEDRTTTENWSIYNLKKRSIGPNLSITYRQDKFELMYSLSAFDYSEKEPQSAGQNLEVIENRVSFGFVF